MRRLFTVVVFLCLAGFALGQMQDNPYTESGRVLKNAAGQVTLDWQSLLLTNGAWKVFNVADADNEIVNWQCMTNYVGVTPTNFFVPSYAEGWTTNGTLTLTTLNQWYPWATWTPGEYTADSIGWTNNGVYIKSAAGEGMYQITGNLSVSLDAATEEVQVRLWRGTGGVATTIVPKIGSSAWMAVATKGYPMPVGGFVRLVIGDYLEIRYRDITSGGKTISAVGRVINFRMNKISN